MEGIKIDWETADRITCENLIEHRDMLTKDLELYGDGKWLHPEDVVLCKERVDAMNILIKYFGS